MKKYNLLVVTVLVGAVVSFASAAVSTVTLRTNLLAQGLFQEGDSSLRDMENDQRDAEQFQQQKQDEKRHLTDRTRECKDMNRQVKQAQKSGSKSAAEIVRKVSDFCGSVEKARKSLESLTNIDDLADLRSDVIQPEIGDVAPDIWDSLNALNAESDVLRGIKEQKGTCKNFARTLKDITREAKRAKIDVTDILAEGQAKIQECEQNYRKIQDMVSRAEWDDARDILQDYFWNNDNHEYFQNLREEAMACSGFGRIISESDRQIKMVEKALKKFQQRGLDTAVAEEYFQEARDIVAQARELSQQKSCDRSVAEDLGLQLEEIGGKVEQELDDLKAQL